MVYNVFSVRDRLVGFGAPFLDISVEAAKRGFAYMFTGDNLKSFKPTDFELYRLGTFDMSLGTFVCNEPPVFICAGDEVVNK